MCWVPKDKLDDIDSSFPARTKDSMLEAMDQALNHGIFPGWERERAAALSKSKLGQGKVQPKPIKHPRTGKISQSRKAHAASAIGRHFELCFYDYLKGVDLHDKVYAVHYVLYMTICLVQTCR
jgi:hypothetical protein